MYDDHHRQQIGQRQHAGPGEHLLRQAGRQLHRLRRRIHLGPSLPRPRLPGSLVDRRLLRCVCPCRHNGLSLAEFALQVTYLRSRRQPPPRFPAFVPRLTLATASSTARIPASSSSISHGISPSPDRYWPPGCDQQPWARFPPSPPARRRRHRPQAAAPLCRRASSRRAADPAPARRRRTARPRHGACPPPRAAAPRTRRSTSAIASRASSSSATPSNCSMQLAGRVEVRRPASLPRNHCPDRRRRRLSPPPRPGPSPPAAARPGACPCREIFDLRPLAVARPRHNGEGRTSAAGRYICAAIRSASRRRTSGPDSR